MKRIIIVLTAVAVMAGTAFDAAARGRRTNSSEVVELIRSYNHEEGFEFVSVGNMGLGLMKMIARAAAETEEEKAAVNMIKGIGKIYVVEYEDAAQGMKDSFNQKVSRVLDGAEKILEVKDDGETVNIYGTSADDGETISDLMIYVPEECALVCLFGTISSKNIADLIEVSM